MTRTKAFSKAVCNFGDDLQDILVVVLRQRRSREQKQRAGRDAEHDDQADTAFSS